MGIFPKVLLQPCSFYTNYYSYSGCCHRSFGWSAQRALFEWPKKILKKTGGWRQLIYLINIPAVLLEDGKKDRVPFGGGRCHPDIFPAPHWLFCSIWSISEWQLVFQNEILWAKSDGIRLKTFQMLSWCHSDWTVTTKGKPRNRWVTSGSVWLGPSTRMTSEWQQIALP